MKRQLEVIAISEPKLHANNVSNVHISNYKLLRTDSSTCAGGVCLYIKGTIKFRLRNDLLLKLKHCKDLSLEVECKGSNLIVAVVYRHPNQDMLSFQGKLCENLNNMEQGRATGSPWATTRPANPFGVALVNTLIFPHQA